MIVLRIDLYAYFIILVCIENWLSFSFKIEILWNDSIDFLFKLK